MALDKDSLRAFSNYLSKISILVVPGMVVVEMVFHKGLLSGNIQNIPELVLLIIWSVAFSVPYYAFATVAMAVLELSLEELEKGEQGLFTTGDDYEMSLLLTLILIVITCAIYKILVWLNWPPYPAYAGVKREYALCVVSVVLTMVAGVPVAVVYYWFTDKLFTWLIEHKIRKTKNKPRGQ